MLVLKTKITDAVSLQPKIYFKAFMEEVGTRHPNMLVLKTKITDAVSLQPKIYFKAFMEEV